MERESRRADSDRGHSIATELRAINVKQRVSIFQALEFIGVDLFHGHSTQQIICPFHDDTKPSARAYGDTQKVFCFTCHKLWDSITVVMDGKSVGFSEAIQLIEDHFKLESPLENLPLTVQYNVNKARNNAPSLAYLQSYVEERLIASRCELGLERYVKYLTVVDLLAHYWATKRVKEDEYRDTLRKVLSKLPQPV